MDSEIIFLSVFIIFIILAKIIESKKRKVCTSETEGVVLDNEYTPLRKRETRNEGPYAPVLQYYANGQKYERVGQKGVIKYKIGKTVRIKYDPDNPSNFYMVDAVKYNLLNFLCIGFVIFVASAILAGFVILKFLAVWLCYVWIYVFVSQKCAY